MTDLEKIRNAYPVPSAWLDEGFPQPRSWKICNWPLREDRHPSGSIFDEGRKWKDHGTGESGDVFSFIMKANNCDFKEAKDIIINRLGWENKNGKGSFPNRHRRSVKKKSHSVFKDQSKPITIKPMPADVAALWDEGCNWLNSISGNSALVDLDRERGWLDDTAMTVFEDGFISMPVINGIRVIAFAVQFPSKDGLMQIGFHYRLPDKSWRYYPNEKLHKISIPAVPFILGAGFFNTARLIIVLEGQWDAISFASVADWLCCDTAWPENISIAGIRGASGWGSFMEHWHPLCHGDANFLLIRDADKAGDSFEQFAEALMKLSHKVVLLKPKRPGSNDLSDMCQNHNFDPCAIWDKLRNLKIYK